MTTAERWKNGGMTERGAGERLVLFDGERLDGWRMAGPGHFDIVDGALETHGGMGLLWYGARQFADFVLELDWQASRREDNSGVFVRFPDPGDDPWAAVRQGYEVQILDAADEPERRTAAIYTFAGPTSVPSLPPGGWNHFEIRVRGQEYTVALNGVEVTRFVGDRAEQGFVGLQNHDDRSRVRFREIRVEVGG